jgi:hypothetical protein
MVRVSVNGTERDLRDVTASWLREHIEAARNKGLSFCVRVTINSGDVDMILSTPSCPSGAGIRRSARPREREILDLWDKRGLNSDDFNIGQLNAFLNQIKNV